MKYIPKLNVRLFVIPIIFILLTSCEDTVTDYEDPPGTAQVRIINSAANVGDLDFCYKWLESGSTGCLAQDVNYLDQYGYYSFETSKVLFYAYYENTNIIAAKDTVDLLDGEKYSIIASNKITSINPSLITFFDTNDEPSDGEVLLRFINLTADVEDLDITELNNIPIQNNLSQYSSSPYIDFDEGVKEFIITNSNSAEKLLNIGPLTFIEGTVYTIIISGSSSDLINTPINYKVYQDTDS